jgi:membrane protein YdbS with pleckstrin-like domain
VASALSTTSGRLPRRLNRVLLRTEQVLFAVRKHPAEIAWPLLGTLFGFFLAIALTPTLGAGHETFQVLIWVAWAVLLGYAAWRYANWRVTFFVITGRRIILLTGLFTKRSKTMPIAKLTELEVIESPVSQVFNFATFRIESAGDADLGRIRFMPYPEYLYEEIMLRVTGPLQGDMIDPVPVRPGGGDDNGGDDGGEGGEDEDPGF